MCITCGSSPEMPLQLAVRRPAEKLLGGGVGVYIEEGGGVHTDGFQ